MAESSEPIIFPNSRTFVLPPGKHAAASPYIKGSYVVKLSGPGASKATNEEISREITRHGFLHHKNNSTCYVNPVDSILERVIHYRDGPKAWLDGTKINFKTHPENLNCQIAIYDPFIVETTFSVDWVPISVPPSEIQKIVSNFCHVERISQDNIRTRHFITTRSKKDNIPHWIHIHNLIENEDKIRTLRVTVKGRKPKCQYCSKEDHPWYLCPSKAEIIKLREKIDPQTLQTVTPKEAIPKKPKSPTKVKLTTPKKISNKSDLPEPPPKVPKIAEKQQALNQLKRLAPKPKTRDSQDMESPITNISLEQIQKSPELPSPSRSPPSPLKTPELPPPVPPPFIPVNKKSPTMKERIENMKQEHAELRILIREDYKKISKYEQRLQTLEKSLATYENPMAKEMVSKEITMYQKMIQENDTKIIEEYIPLLRNQTKTIKSLSADFGFLIEHSIVQRYKLQDIV